MSDISEIKSLLEAQGSAWEEFKSANDALLKAKADGKAVGDLTAKVETLSAALDSQMVRKDELEAKLTDIEKRWNRVGGKKDDRDIGAETKQFNAMRRSLAAPGRQVPDITEEQCLKYAETFGQFVRRGWDGLQDDERKAMISGSDPDGGFLLPAPAVGQIAKKVFELSPLRGLFGQQTISGDAIEGVEDTGEADAGWVGETQSRAETSSPQVGKWRIEAREMYAQPKASQRLLDDNVYDVETWLAAKVADKFARTEANAFLNGAGVTSPRGLMTYTTAATGDDSRAWGVFEHKATANNSDFASSDPGNILFDVVGALKAYYQQNGSWLTRREVITKVRKFKGASSGDYLWQPGLQRGIPDQLLGFPVVYAQDVPTLATGSLSMAFGDFRSAYLIVDRVGIRTLRDPYTEKPYVKFYSTMRCGGGAVNFEAAKFIKFGS